jgi:predicted dehydrogenase
MPYRVAIIGAGRIGSSLDDPRSPDILTHAHGYKACEAFEIAGFVDRDLSKAVIAASCWGGRAFGSVQALFETQNIDVVSICVPDELHFETMLALAKMPVKFIFLEKPAVRTIEEADLVGAIYSNLPTRILVNYTRRFLPEIKTIREAIRNGHYGAYLTGVGYYGKGLLHNGSHMVDLLNFLVGEISDVQKLEEIADFYDQDPAVSALLTMRVGGIFLLRHIDCRKFDVFELDLTFEKKRIRIRDFGGIIEEYSLGDNSVYTGYRTLNKGAEYQTEHRSAMYHAISNIHNNLEFGETLVCTLEESLETVRTCERIRRGEKK